MGGLARRQAGAGYLMDIATQAEVLLRDAQYDTWSWSAVKPPITCFENAVIMGFLHVFPSGRSLVEEWEERQKSTLTRFTPALRSCGEKGWNIYSVFLTSDQDPEFVNAIDRIEENFAFTRKIARWAIQNTRDLEAALLPLRSIASVPVLGTADFEKRLRSQLREVPSATMKAFMSGRPAHEVARLLEAEK